MAELSIVIVMPRYLILLEVVYDSRSCLTEGNNIGFPIDCGYNDLIFQSIEQSFFQPMRFEGR